MSLSLSPSRPPSLSLLHSKAIALLYCLYIDVVLALSSSFLSLSLSPSLSLLHSKAIALPYCLLLDAAESLEVQSHSIDKQQQQQLKLLLFFF